MRVLAIDPGAKRQGWAVVDGDGTAMPKWKASGISGLERKEGEEYQKYRLRLILFWSKEGTRLLRSFDPDVLVSEIVPVKGGGQFVAAAQSQLAATAITSVQCLAYLNGYDVDQIGATTVKSQIGGSNKATKVRVRNGVWEWLPTLRDRAKMWSNPKAMDECDALAIALTYLGYSNRTI